jgi:surface protein
VQWGCLQLGNSGNYFYGCKNLELSTTDNLNLTETSNLMNTFTGCSNLGEKGNLNNWDVSNVTDMSRMFEGASSFNQPLGSWNVSNVINMEKMFKCVKLSTSNYNQLLRGWSQLNLQYNVTFDAGNSKFSSFSVEARQNIIDNFNWTITDGGLVEAFVLEIPGYNVILILTIFAISVIIITKIKYRMT